MASSAGAEGSPDWVYVVQKSFVRLGKQVLTGDVLEPLGFRAF